MLPKYVGNLFIKDLIQKISKSILYFLIISINYICSNFNNIQLKWNSHSSEPKEMKVFHYN